MPESQDPIQNPLTNRFFLSQTEKQSKETGKKLVRSFYTQQTSNGTSLNFFQGRNARQIMLLLWAKGSQNISEFLGYMSVSDANRSWINIDTTQSRIAPQFVGTLVESMAKNSTYACVDAVDDGSRTEKEDRLFEALFRMNDVDTISTVQQESGIQLEPPTAFVPDDEQAARVYFELQDRLPKEIRFEKMIASVRDDIKFERVLNRKTLYDLTVLNMAFTKIEKVAPGKYTVRKCVPTNMIYNFFINDTGDCEITMIGEFYSLKVRDLRKKFGKSEERPDGLSEKEIFEMARQYATEKNIGVFNYKWDENYALNTFSMNRPYDDASVLVLDCEIDCGEDAYFVAKKDAYGREDIQAKKSVPYQQKKADGSYIQQPKPEDVEIIKKRKNTWMRGVYAPYGDTMLYWGSPDIIISQYTDVYNPLSSYTVNIPNNDGEYVPSLFERIMEPLREYQLSKLKRKQLISQLRPSGIRIDVESARNIDLGNGNTIEWDEVLRIYNQTGTEVWSSKGIDPLQPQAPAITNTAADDAIAKIVNLTGVLEGIRAEIRELIGVPPYRDGSDVGDRTSGVLQEQQSNASYNVSDFVLNGNNQLWEETFYKLCLLHWNDIVKTEPESSDDMLNTRFKVAVKMKATEYEKQLIEQDITRFSQMPDANGNPLLSPKDAIMIRNIQNYKLMALYLDSVVKENRKKAIEDSQRLQAQNAQIQQQSAQMAAEQQSQIQAQELQANQALEQYKAAQQKELVVLTGMFDLFKNGMSVPPEWAPVLQALIPNVLIPIQTETKQAVQAVQQQAMAEQQQAQQEQEAQENPDAQAQPM